MLEKLNEFALKHKIKWGADKCKVMRIGKHKEKRKEWKIGDMPITETSEYKYLGDWITDDGKNKLNIEMRRKKITNDYNHDKHYCIIRSTQPNRNSSASPFT